MFELIEVGADREVASSHDGPPSWSCPRSAVRGVKGDSYYLNWMLQFRWTQSCPRTGGALCATRSVHLSLSALLNRILPEPLPFSGSFTAVLMNEPLPK